MSCYVMFKATLNSVPIIWFNHKINKLRVTRKAGEPPLRPPAQTTTHRTKHPDPHPHQPLMCSQCFWGCWNGLAALLRDPKLPRAARPDSLEILRLVCVTPLPFGHWLPKGPMSYKILMGESVASVRLSVCPSVRMYVPPSVPPLPLPPPPRCCPTGYPIGCYRIKTPLGADAPPPNPKTPFTRGIRVPMTVTASWFFFPSPTSFPFFTHHPPISNRQPQPPAPNHILSWRFISLCHAVPSCHAIVSCHVMFKATLNYALLIWFNHQINKLCVSRRAGEPQPPSPP
jgi:hypothetical protein